MVVPAELYGMFGGFTNAAFRAKESAHGNGTAVIYMLSKSNYTRSDPAKDGLTKHE